MIAPSRGVVLAALVTGALLVGHDRAFAQGGRPGEPRRPAVLAQAPATPADTAGAAAPPVGLPRVRDYEPIADLRDIHFDSGAATIRPVDVKILEANAAWLRANPDRLLLIEGHSDNRGVRTPHNELNMDLGERRAKAAMDYLVAHGVHPGRITILSYGEERPRCPEQTERCWSQNRRSSFLVKPR